MSLLLQILYEFLFEILVPGTGYVFLRFISPKSEPGETACAITGITLWVGVAALGWFVYRHAVGT